MKGIKITLTNGTVEHFDPVPSLTIDNTFYDYHFDTENIEKIEVYEVEDSEGKEVERECAYEYNSGKKHNQSCLHWGGCRFGGDSGMM